MQSTRIAPAAGSLMLATALITATPLPARAESGFFGIFGSSKSSDLAQCTRLENPPAVKLEACTKFLDSSPSAPAADRARAYTERGIARQYGKYSQDAEQNRLAAIDDYTAAIQADPNFAPAYLRRARAMDGWKDDQREAAINDFATAMRLDPNDAEARLYYEGWTNTEKVQDRPIGATEGALTPTIGHAADIVSALFSADGRNLYSGDKNGVVKVWEVATGRLIRSFGHTKAGDLGYAAQLALSKSQESLVVGDSLGRVRAWNPTTGALIREYDMPSCGTCPVDTPVAQMPNGQALVGALDGNVRWLSDSGSTPAEVLKAHLYEGSLTGVKALAVSPDGKLLASSGVEDYGVMKPGLLEPEKLEKDYSQGVVVIWKRQGSGWTTQRRLDERTLVKNLVFLPGGKQLLGAAGKSLKLWDVASGRVVKTLEGHSADVCAMTLSPDGRTLFSVDYGTGTLSDDGKSGAVYRWDIASGQSQVLSPLGARGASIWGGEAIAVSPDGRTVVLTGARLQQIDAQTGALVREFNSKHDGGYPAFVGAGKEFITTGSDAVRLFDAVSGRLVRRFEPSGTNLRRVAASPDGKFAAGFGEDKKTRLYDVATGKVVSEIGPATANWVRLRFTPDSRRIAIADEKNLGTWQVPGGQPDHQFENAAAPFSVDDFAFTGAGEQVVMAHGGSYIGSVGDLKNGPRFKMPEVYIQQWTRVAMADGGKFAVGGSIDGALIFMETKSWYPVGEFRIHKGEISSMTSSKDGSIIYSGGYDGAIKRTDGHTGKLLGEFSDRFPTVVSLSLSADGTRLISGGSDEVARMWDTASGQLLASYLATADGEWLVITPEGYFNASSPRAAELLSIVHGMRVSSIDQVYQALYRPDLVREKLAGDAEGLVKAAAAKLDLNKVLQSGSAPSIDIVTPAPGTTTQTITIKVEITVTDQGGGVGRIEWRVNGVTQGDVGKRGLARIEAGAGKPGGKKSTTISQELSLEPGENSIEVVAYNEANLIASTPGVVKVSLATETATKPRLHVLAIGVNDYFDSRLRLAYAVPDAKSLAAAFEKAGVGHYEGTDAMVLTDSQVTRAGLEAAFKTLGEKMRPSDVLIFFAAGHGVTRDGRYYFLPSDFRYHTEASIADSGIGQELWQSWFAQLPARKSVLLYDTCESGTLAGPATQKIAMRSGLEQQAALGRLIQATGRTVLTASTSDKPALEGYNGHGVFTYALLEGLARADRNANNLIEVTELAGFVDAQVPEITQKAFGLRQVPQMSIQGSDFALATRLAALDGEAGGSDTPSDVIPEKATHVVLEAVDVFQEAGGRGKVVQKMKAATSFAVVKSSNGWTLIARDGKTIGYIREDKAVRLQ